MATNTPVIVSEVGGLSEIVEDRHTGLKVPPGHESKLAEAIIQVLTDSDLADRLTHNAAQLVDSVYNWDNIACNTCEVYKEVVARAKVKKVDKSEVS